MRLLHLSLTNFRNYCRLELDPPAGVIVLQGDNAQGKTNLLEGIYYLSRMHSPRTSVDRELINWLALEDDLPFARLVGQFQSEQRTDQIELSMVQSSGKRPNDNAAALRKHIRVNGANKRVLDAVGLLSTVLFMPQDINLVSGAPYLRRRYLDDTISQMDPQYSRELQEYNRVLTQRNYLLKSLRDARNDSGQLLFWDQGLVEHGTYVTVRRQHAIQLLDEFIQDIHPRLTAESEQLRLEYCASVRLEGRPGTAYQIPLMAEDSSAAGPGFSLHAVAASFAEQLHEVRAKELEQGVSIIGPHRDDFRFLTDGVDMNIYGSRGQQRTVTLSLKLAEVEWVTQEKVDKPLLLLDDVASELDAVHRDCLWGAIDRAQQVIITTTGVTQFDEAFLERATRWQVRGGRIQELNHP